MCCRDFAACMYASIFTIVQTIVHLSFCMWGTTLYKCNTEMDKTSFNYFWYLTYFYSDACTNVTLKDIVYDRIVLISNFIDVSEIDEVEFPRQSAYASRTYNILVLFIILDTLWLISAINLLIGACCRIKKMWALLWYFPWPTVLLIMLFLDAITFGLYAMDIYFTHGIKNWFYAIGGKHYAILDKVNIVYPEINTVVPSILMMFIFIRFIVIWLINLFLFFRINQASINAFQEFDDQESLASRNV
ncbi:hypothetical protein RN001_009967 [Aquatica leii]|uniref:Uncharacterized protein n=1 Tax=Aquatica leii TaxID=1421715 RepID=A0AAN7P9D3_9COLE|nr:hypothetical protein RN001_009967 [Aquatica leii]